MKVLLTGGTGFLGQALLASVPKDVHVIFTGRCSERGTVLSHKYHCPFVPLDLGETARLRHALQGVDAVIHNAALSSAWGPRQAFYEANVVGTQNILAAAQAAGVERFVYISSPSVYFNFHHQHNITEEKKLPKRFCNAYAWSKATAEKYVLNTNLSHIILRPRGLFGPQDTSVFPRILRLAQTGTLSLPSRRNPLVDLTYVDNVADAVWLALRYCQQHSGEIFNITNGEPAPLKTLLNQLLSACRKPAVYRTYPYAWVKMLVGLSAFKAKLFQEKEPRLTPYTAGLLHYDMTLNIDKAKKKLGYAPKISIKEGIERYAHWYRSTCA